MSSLFNASDTQQIIARINKLTTNSQPLWGKMNVTQMLEHCEPPLKVAFGDLKLKRGLIGILFGGMAKKQLMGEKPFRRNLPTAPQFLVKDYGDFESEKQKLIGLVEKFQENGPEGLSKDPHPFFGKLTPEEWDTLQWKHLDHHLNQFGA